MNVTPRSSTAVAIRENPETESLGSKHQRSVRQVAPEGLLDENSPSKLRKIAGDGNFIAASSPLRSPERFPLENITNSPVRNSASSAALPSVFVRPAPLTFISDIVDSEKPIFTREQLAELGVEKIDAAAATTPHSLLSKEGYQMASDSLGHGQFGIVYDLIHKTDLNKKVYKLQIKPKPIEHNCRELWRNSDFAVAELGDKIPHLAKINSYLVTITMLAGVVEHFCVPSAQVKRFMEAIPFSAEVKIKGMLMEKAPGKNLAQLLEEGSIAADLSDPHFCRIVVAMHEFASGAYAYNFIHGDIKPANIMYDLASKKVTIIDTGESLLLYPRDQKEARAISSSQSLIGTTTKKTRGTRHFMAPAITLGHQYGSEVDFFSIGMTLLSLINKEDLHSVTKKRFSGFGQWDKLFAKRQPPEFLATYLGALESNNGSPSLTVACLEAQPKLRQIIELDFLISGGGPEGESALVQLGGIISDLKEG